MSGPALGKPQEKNKEMLSVDPDDSPLKGACHRDVFALIPAGGYSSRMQVFKPLLPLGKTTVIEQTISLFQAAGIKEVFVVTGHNRERLSPVIQKACAIEVFNPDYDAGMFSSIRAGVAAFPKTCQGFFLLPADIPAIRPATLAILLERFSRNPEAVVVPEFSGGTGHPPLIPASFMSKILSAPPGGNLRQILFSNDPGKSGKSAVTVLVPDRGILMDADRPKEYEKLKERICRMDIPDTEECLEVMKIAGAGQDLRAHMELVASTARVLWQALQEGFPDLNPDLINAGALLHDICRPLPDHARAGRDFLLSLGFCGAAKIAGSHMDLSLPASGLTEAAVVYLADKICRGSRLDMDYETRFLGKAEKYPHARERIMHRLEIARHIQSRVESAAGRSLGQILG